MAIDHDLMRKKLGERLRSIREAAHLTQKDVADAAGMHVNYYARIERGEENPTYDKLLDLKKALKLDSLDILL